MYYVYRGILSMKHSESLTPYSRTFNTNKALYSPAGTARLTTYNEKYTSNKILYSPAYIQKSDTLKCQYQYIA